FIAERNPFRAEPRSGPRLRSRLDPKTKSTMTRRMSNCQILIPLNIWTSSFWRLLGTTPHPLCARPFPHDLKHQTGEPARLVSTTSPTRVTAAAPDSETTDPQLRGSDVRHHFPWRPQ